MKYKVYSDKDFERLLKTKGYSIIRYNGSHKIWGKAGSANIVVPKSTNPMVLRRLIKENKLGDEGNDK